MMQTTRELIKWMLALMIHRNKRTSQTQKTLHPKSIPKPSTTMENPRGHLGIVLHLCGQFLPQSSRSHQMGSKG
jgi:hypothetical protein